MRYVIPWLGLGGLLLAAGCTNTRLGFIGRTDNPPPPASGQTPTVAALVKYLDDFGKQRPFPNTDRPLDFKHLKAVALVQDDASREILQAVQVDVGGEARAH